MPCISEAEIGDLFSAGQDSGMQNLPDATSEEFVFPQPDAQGIAETKELYFNKLGRTLTDAEAAEALGRVMRYLFLQFSPCSSTESIPESPTTTAQ